MDWAGQKICVLPATLWAQLSDQVMQNKLKQAFNALSVNLQVNL